jgi:lupus La protein
MEQFVDAIIAAIKSSPPQNFTLDEEKKALKRTQAIPVSDVTAPRTMWVEVVPENTVWQQLFEFFKPHGDVISVRVQKKKDSDAKPCAFVEFDSPETLEKVCKLDLTFEGIALKLQPKKVFIASLKKKADTKTKKDPESEEAVTSASVKDELSFMAKGAGSVLKLLGLGPSCSRETIKEVFGEYGQIAFVDFERGWSDGWLRFDDASDAAAAAAGFCAKPVDVGGAIPTVSLLAGDEETAYLKKAELERGNKFNRGGRGGRGGHSRGGRGGRGGKGGRDSRDARDSRDSREGGSKKRKVDSED